MWGAPVGLVAAGGELRHAEVERSCATGEGWRGAGVRGGEVATGGELGRAETGGELGRVEKKGDRRGARAHGDGRVDLQG